MAFQVRNTLRFFTFDSFSDLGITHGVFTRLGGISPDPWRSLNVGGTVGDDLQRVKKNRLRTCQSLSIRPGQVFDSWQVHGNAIEKVDHPYEEAGDLVKADGLITGKPEIALMMRFADCVPIFLADPVKRVIGLAHAGWKGTLLEVALEAVRQMQAEFGTHPADIRSGIGPSIGPDHYEVGEDVAKEVANVYPDEINQVLLTRNGRAYLDLWQANEITLERAGVKLIEKADICTACHLDDWYSHRGEGGQTGRFAAILQMPG